MKTSSRCAAFILTLWFTGFSARSQNDTLFFRHYSIENGLSHSNVTSIIQDSLGFMWYGTRAGLNKFDGYGFITFKHDPKNKNSLVNDDISCMTVEKSGIIWIGTRIKGVNRLDPYTGVFTVFQHKANDPGSLSEDLITGIYADTITGLIWIGTASNGLNVYSPTKKTFKHYNYDPDAPFSISHNSISCIVKSKSGEFWIGTNGGGVNVFNSKTETFHHYQHYKNGNSSICSDTIRSIYFDNKTSQVWAATANGLSVINLLNNTIKNFQHRIGDPYSISSNDLTCVYQDKAGKIWAGTHENGLNVYYPNSDKFYLYSHESKELNTLSSNNINSVSQGRSGMFWAATRDGGLNAFNPKSLKFRLFTPFSYDKSINESLTSIYESKDGKFWIGTNGKGIIVYNPTTAQPESNIEVVRKNSVFEINGDDTGIIISTTNGIQQYDFYSRKLSDLLVMKSVTCTFRDKENIIWIGTKDKGVYSYDLRSKKTDSYPQIHLNSPVSYLMKDSQGMIWAGTYGDGAVMLNPGKGIFAVYKNEAKDPHSIGSNYINSISEDSKGNVWFSTWGGGLNVYRRNENIFNCYSTQDGLPTNSIGKILIDKSDNLWISTDNGICRLTFEKLKLLQCRIFDLSDGLPTLEFYNGASLRMRNGDMIFTCEKGLVNFNPDSLKNNPYKPPVIITDFQVFNKSIQPGDSTGILSSSISVTKELNLSYKQNVFSFEFTAISFINALQNKYAYKMEGFDKDWIYTDASRRFATYTNLSPGHYNFIIKASNNDGTWNEAGTSLLINILPPFYKTWWFISLCLGYCILAIYGIHKYRMRQVLNMLHVRNKIASDLHDDIGSGLSSIAVLSEIIRQRTGNRSEDIAPFLEKIDQTSRSMSEAIHDIVWTINPDNDKIEDVLKRMRSFATEILGGKKIKVRIDFCEEIIACKLSMEIRKNFYLIFKEAIHNIVKYARAKSVNVSVSSSKDLLEMIIVDDGIGFDMTKACDGNGLINMRRRAIEMGGKLTIDSREGSGTKLQLDFKPS